MNQINFCRKTLSFSVSLKLTFSCSWGEFQWVDALRLIRNWRWNVYKHDGFASFLEVRLQKICQFWIPKISFSFVAFQWPNYLAQLRQWWIDMLSLFESIVWYSTFFNPFTACQIHKNKMAFPLLVLFLLINRRFRLNLDDKNYMGSWGISVW